LKLGIWKERLIKKIEQVIFFQIFKMADKIKMASSATVFSNGSHTVICKPILKRKPILNLSAHALFKIESKEKNSGCLI
jgi:hypothetical protein